MATNNPITDFVPGEDRIFTVTIATSVDITGWTIEFQLKTVPDPDAAALITKTAVITDAANGTFTLTLDSADSADLKPGIYYYDVVRTDAGNKTRLAYGEFRALRHVFNLGA